MCNLFPSGLLAVMTAVSLVILVTVLEKRDQRRKDEHTSKNGEEPTAQHGGRVAAIEKSIYPSEAEHRATEQRHWGWQIRLNFAALVLSIVAAVATVLGYMNLVSSLKAAQDQATAARDQVSIMIAERRPWLKIEPERIIQYRSTNYPNLSEINDEFSRGFFDVVFKITNVGHAPAFNVQFHMWAFVPFEGHNDVLTEQHERCERLRKSPLDNPARGVIIFPGDHIIDTDLGMGGHLIGAISIGDVKQSTRERGHPSFMAHLYGCADYTFEVGEKHHHQTGMMYMLAHTFPREGLLDGISFGFDPSENMPGEAIKMYPLPSSSGQTD